LPFLLNLNFLAGDKCMAKLANGKYRDAVVDSIVATIFGQRYVGDPSD
jgi:hypothetical protein